MNSGTSASGRSSRRQRQSGSASTGTALAGMAQITARHWLGQNGTLSRDDAATLIGALAWRGLGSIPMVAGEGSDAS